MKNIFAKTILSLFVAFAVFGFASRARATSAGNLGILPAYPDPQRELTKNWFLYTVDRGEGKKDAVKIVNNSDKTKVVKVYPVDAVNTKEGTFALLDEVSPREGIGKWIRMASETLEVPAKSAKLDPFEINIPENAEVGDHLGGIVVQEVDPKNMLSGTGVNIVSRVGVRIYETVPGEIKKDFEIKSFNWKPSPKEKRNWLLNILGLEKRIFFEAEITNTGNVRFSPETKIEVKNIFGRKAAEIKDKNHRVIFSKGSAMGTAFWERMPFAGRYRAILSVSVLAPDGARLDPKTREITFWIFPWQFILIMLALAAGAAILIFIRKQLQKILRSALPAYQVSGNESLQTVGKKFGLDWRKIAAVNNLKKPYLLKKGDQLRMPVSSKESGKIRMSSEGWQKLRKAILMRRIIIVGLIVVISAAAFFSRQVSKKMGAGSQRQKIQAPKNDREPKEETDQTTEKGVLKKSAVSIGLLAPVGSDPVSSQRLARKLELVGYKLEPISSQRSEYTLTTIEYKVGKKEIAEMVKGDLGVSDPVNLVERENLAKDAIIWNFLPPSAFLEI